MALTPGFQIPFGIQPLNPIPVDSWSGPYEGITVQGALTAANAAIPYAVRFQGMEVRLIVNAVPKKYWYCYGIADSDLITITPANEVFTSSVSAPALSGAFFGDGQYLTNLKVKNTNTGVVNINSVEGDTILITPDFNNRITTIDTTTQSVTALLEVNADIPVGTNVTLINTGTNTITIQQSVPVAGQFISRNDYRKLVGVASVATILKLSTNNWFATGTLTE